MGMWALQPWDNDAAADWFGDLMDSTSLRARWLEGIRADPSDEPEVVRAAGALFVMLGRVYVWPIDQYDQDLEIAIAALAKVAQADSFTENTELVAAIEAEIAELKTRRKSAQAPSGESQRPWWKFWG